MATQVWAWQGGTTNNDAFDAVVMGSDGSSVSAGYTNGTGFGVFAQGLAAVKLDSEGSVLWEWVNDTTCCGVYEITAAAMDQDGSVALAGRGEEDFLVIKLDSDGTLLWYFQEGTLDYDYAEAITMVDDGSVVVVGRTEGDWDIPNIGSFDMVAFKLDADATLLWTWQDGTAGFDSAQAVAVAEDGSVVLAGFADKDFGGVDEGVHPFAAIKLNSEGSEVWRWQNGTREFDFLVSISVANNGSFVMAGYTDGVWTGVDNAGGFDFAAVKLDADGNEIWRWQDGTSESDSLTAAVVQADGSIILGGTTRGDWSGLNAGGSDFAAVALDAEGEELWRWQSGAAGSDADDVLRAMGAGNDGRIVLAGVTEGSWREPNFGGEDYVVVMLDSGALATPSPSETPSPAVAEAPGVIPRAPTRPTPQPLTTQAPSPGPTTAVAVPQSPTPNTANSTPIVAGVAAAVAGAALVVLGICLRKRYIAKNNTTRQASIPFVEVDGGVVQPPSYEQMTAAGADISEVGGIHQPFPEAFAGVVPPATQAITGESKGGGGRGVSHAQQDSAPARHPDKDRGGTIPTEQGGTEPITRADKGASGGGGSGGVGLADGYVEDGSTEPALTVTTSTANISTAEPDAMSQAYGGDGAASAGFVSDVPKPTADEIDALSSSGRRAKSSSLRLAHAVGDAAQELARSCHVPGVSEAAAVVSILVNLVTDNGDAKNVTYASLRRCRSIILMLQRAAKVLGKGGDTTGKAERAMMEDVHDAIFDLVELIKTYQSKSRLSQLLMSTLFKRREEQLGAVVDKAILGMQLGLHVQVGNDVSAVKQDVGAFKDSIHQFQGSVEEAQSKSLADARSARRQHKLDQIEIPEGHVSVTDELLGKGGFGEVFLADYNGRNAAAKVMYVSHDLVRRGESEVLDGSTAGQRSRQREKRQHNAFLRELDAMIRLRSPYTINVYGVVTSLDDRLVLVMELLSGGDLRKLLSNSEQPLPEEQSRQIIGDICTGMAFLHSKEAVHGDLKSANVLLDGAGRAKIGDFGTSRWAQHAMSTGLATFTTKSSKNTQMSLHWSAPELLKAGGSTYATDVYSFGIVVWEVLSRELPWATMTGETDIYIRVVLNKMRPDIPEDAPADIADVARACWAGEPGDRPTFSAVMEGMSSKPWNV